MSKRAFFTLLELCSQLIRLTNDGNTIRRFLLSESFFKLPKTCKDKRSNEVRPANSSFLSAFKGIIQCSFGLISETSSVSFPAQFKYIWNMFWQVVTTCDSIFSSLDRNRSSLSKVCKIFSKFWWDSFSKWTTGGPGISNREHAFWNLSCIAVWLRTSLEWDAMVVSISNRMLTWAAERHFRLTS